MKEVDVNVLNRICDRAFYIALRMIHVANYERAKAPKGEPKVGGHPAACGSSKHILSAIHLVCRNPEDYIACKPHVSPMDHALNYLLHNFRDSENKLFDESQRRAAMRNLRHFSREGEPVFQSYHAETDPDGFRFFPSGSVGIPPVTALYTSLGYEFAKDHGFEIDEDPRFWCLMGDSEFREGSLMEAMPDAGERQLGRMIWIVDYNRQNLDGVRVSNETALRGTDADRISAIAIANGWDAMILEHGKYREELFARDGGSEFKRVIDEISEFEFQALLEANDPSLTRKVLAKKSDKLKSWLKDLSEEDIHRALLNLGGHDMGTLVEAFQKARNDITRPTLIVPYTIKGHGLKCQAMSGNHSSLPEGSELDEMAEKIGMPADDYFAEFAGNSPEGKFLSERGETLVNGIQDLLAQIEKRREDWKEKARAKTWPVDLNIKALKFAPQAHTQWMWGQVAAKLDRLGRGLEMEDGAELTESDQTWKEFAPLFLTMAPDVGSSTNTSPNMNGKLYGDIGQKDWEAEYQTKDKKAPDVIPSTAKQSGHLRFEIAEGNCMSAAGAIGKFKQYVGIPFYPAMTIYDFFIKRCHDQFYYNLYWKSSFATIGTPSGISLAPEGAQHSWKSDFQIPHCVTWEPAFAKEMEWILADTLRRHFTEEDDERESTLFRGTTKGLEQKEFLGRLKRQARFKAEEGDLSLETADSIAPLGEEEIFETIRQEVLKGGYALIDYRGYDDYTPGDNVIHIFAMGALVAEAIKASDELLEKGIFANVFVVTSSDLLLGNFAYHDDYDHLKNGLGVTGDIYFGPQDSENIDSQAKWYSLQGARIPVVSVHDGEPGLLDNIGSVVGVKHKTLAVRKTSKSGTTEDIFYYHKLNGESIAKACIEALEDTARETFQLDKMLLADL